MTDTALVGRSASTSDNNSHALLADQTGIAGTGAAIRAESANSQVPALSVKGAGVLVSAENSSGVTVFSVSQTGVVTANGGISSGQISGDLTVTGGNAVLATAGKGLQVKEGSNATMGTLTLNGATPVVVSTTAVTASSRIFLTHNVVGGTPAFCWVSSRVASTSFSVTGTALDTSTVAWLIVNPSP